MKQFGFIVVIAMVLSVTFNCDCMAQTDRKGSELLMSAIDKIRTAKTRDDLTGSLEGLQQAYSHFDRAGDTKGKAYSLLFSGKVCLSLSDYPKSIDFANRSLGMMKKVGDLNGQAINLDNLGSAHYYTSAYRESLDYFDKSLKIHRSLKNVEGEALTLNNQGNVHVALSDFSKARSLFSESLAKSRKSGSRVVEAACLDSLGYIQNRQGNYPESLEYYEKSLEMKRSLGDVGSEGITLNNIGQVYQEMGQYPKSIEYLEQALNRLNSMGDLFAAHKATNNIGVSLSAMGRYSEALDYYSRSLAGQEKTGDLIGASGSRQNIASVYVKLGQFSKALDAYNSALEICRQTGNKADASMMMTNIAYTLGAMGRTEEAEKSFLEAMRIKEEINVPSSLTRDQLVNFLLDKNDLQRAESVAGKGVYNATLGRIALLKNDFPAATLAYEKTLELAEKSNDADLMFVGSVGLGKSYENAGNLLKAREFYEKALKLTEEIRSAILPAERKNFFDFKMGGFSRSDPAKGLVRILMKLNQPEESISPGELTKARTFADHLCQANATGAAKIPQKILLQEQELANSLAAMKKDLSRTDREKQPEKYDNLSRACARRTSDFERFVENLWKKYPLYAASKYPKSLTLKESGLHSNEHAILFDVCDDGVGVKLLKGKQLIKSVYVNWKKEDLEKFIIKFRAPLEELRFIDFDHELGRQIYNRLLGEILSDVPQRAPLIIVPDGVLAILPFEALVTGGKIFWEKGALGFPDPAGLTFLGDDHSLTYYQSLTALMLVRTFGSGVKPAGRIAVIADPVFEMTDRRAQNRTDSRIAVSERRDAIELMRTIEDSSDGKFRLTRLEATSDMADSLAKMYGEDCLVLKGLEATKADFMAMAGPAMESFGSVVFATHGAMGTKIPGLMEPFLALTMIPPGTDGFLKMSDILSLKMNADVVALTACQTALGRDISGEGVMSMGRAFQYAGAKSVLMTLWEVEEASAVKMTEKFFKYLKDGKTKIEALQLARKDIRNEGYNHPYFWSGFVLVGEASN